MNLSELIEHLKNIMEELDGRDLPVNLTTQPSWPLLSTIGNIRVIDPNEEEIAEIKAQLADMDPTKKKYRKLSNYLQDLEEQEGAYVTLADGSSLGYGSRDAWDAE